jgi:adenosylcobinamide-phosphate synthase
LARIVGRDTANLNEAEVIRATVETVAESLMDGVVAPLFYAAIGGAPFAITYKAINTLDSMVGNRSARYKKFGYFSAKIDEIANWIPARISWFLIGVGAFFVNGRASESWQIGYKDGVVPSPANSIVPEASFAGALGVELGGTNYYSGKAVETQKMGYPTRALEKDDVRTAVQLMQASSWAALIFALFLHFLVSLVVH